MAENNEKNKKDKDNGYVETRSDKEIPNNYQTQLVGNIENIDHEPKSAEEDEQK